MCDKTCVQTRRGWGEEGGVGGGGEGGGYYIYI